jgi:hypothetical protein
MDKILDIDCIKGAKENIHDLKVFGDGDTFKLLCKASSVEGGWMKSTKVANVNGGGCFLQVTTHQKNSDGTNSIAEAVTFAPGVMMVYGEDGIRNLTRI